tara:strand:+ start:22521 stop:23447 length:927 start_codon:yes stop_codon:yes gene_type:complete
MRQNGESVKDPAIYAEDQSQLLYNSGLRLEFGHLASGTSVGFKAFLTNYAEQYASQWNMESALGRMDPIHTFKNTTRSITLGWNLVSNSVMEAAENQKNLSRLIQMLYPAYSKTDSEVKVMSTPPIMKLKFANLIQDVSRGSGMVKSNTTPATNGGAGSPTQLGVLESGLVGRIDGLAVVPDSDAGYIVIPGDDGPLIYPKTIGLNCTFYVIHTHPLGWEGSAKDRRAMNALHPYGMDTGFAKVSDNYNNNQEDDDNPLIVTKKGGADVFIEPIDQNAASADGVGFKKSVNTVHVDENAEESILAPPE